VARNWVMFGMMAQKKQQETDIVFQKMH